MFKSKKELARQLTISENMNTRLICRIDGLQKTINTMDNAIGKIFANMMGLLAIQAEHSTNISLIEKNTISIWSEINSIKERIK